MKRIASVLVLSTFALTAIAQQPASTPAARPGAGDFSGKFSQDGGSGSSDVKIMIKDITKDGRVTARIQASHMMKACAGSLPASGIVNSDGSMRLEVDAGAPEGCERIYMVKSASGGTATGTYVEATRTGGKLIPRKK